VTTATGSRCPRRASARRGSGPSALAGNAYGLTLREVRTEIRRCAAHGWQLWEIRLRFANNRKDDDT
jgi:hypothetical protein